MSDHPIPAAQSALLIVDLQNDFLDPKGAYGRAGQTAADIAALPPRIKPFADLMRSKGGFVISTQFTLVPGKGRDKSVYLYISSYNLAGVDQPNSGW